MTRIAVLVSTPIRPGLAEAIAAGEAPRRDYFELRDAFEAELMAPPESPSAAYRLLRKMGGNALAMACRAWASRGRYDVILTDQESVGLILALLCKLTFVRRGHVMISHYLTPAKKQWFFRVLRVQSHIDRTICYSTAQLALARDVLGLGPDKASLVLHPADSDFWRPVPSDEARKSDLECLEQVGLNVPAEAPLIASAGLEFRDYQTLVKAARRLPPVVHFVIAASSPWSKRKNTAEEEELPPNVHVVSLTPVQLRALYRRALAVAIPLYDVDFQAGSLVAYEAMACGRPVVITRTRAQGQGDIVRENHTGYYVAPGDSDGMAAALDRFLASAGLASSMGHEARRVVERGLNLDTYLTQMAEIVHEVAEQRQYARSPLGRAA